jgi:hypothetical protein
VKWTSLPALAILYVASGLGCETVLVAVTQGGTGGTGGTSGSGGIGGGGGALTTVVSVSSSTGGANNCTTPAPVGPLIVEGTSAVGTVGGMFECTFLVTDSLGNMWDSGCVSGQTCSCVFNGSEVCTCISNSCAETCCPYPWNVLE